jgi:hypothetical protein
VLGKTLTPQRLRALYAAGRLALGTDSRLSGARDLLEELRIAAAHSDFSARELLQLVTVHARRLLHAAPARDDVIVFRRTSADPFADLLGLTRGDLRMVIRNGEPLITDLDFEEWFVKRSIPCTQVLLDGHPKLCASAILSPDGVAHPGLEPGLTL